MTVTAIKIVRFCYFEREKNILRCLAIIFFCLKVCNCSASEQSTDQQQSQEPARNRQNTNELSTYFRHDPRGPGTYAFGYEVNDNKTGNRQFRDERRFSNSTVEGSYGYVRPDGRLSVTHFIADGERGYLSQTRVLEQGDSDQSDWRIYFWTNYENATNKNNSAQMKRKGTETETETENGSNSKTDYIDLQKDLLNPTLMNILNGNFPLKGEEDTTKITQEPKTFENVTRIPNQFPIVPFELPPKLLQNFKSNQIENENESETNSERTSEAKITSTSSTPSTVESSTHSTTSAGIRQHDQTDWISSIVNQTRRQFLDN